MNVSNVLDCLEARREVRTDIDALFDGVQFDELNKLLSDRLPLLDYAAILNAEGAVKILG